MLPLCQSTVKHDALQCTEDIDAACQDQSAAIRAGPLCQEPLLGSSQNLPCGLEAVKMECFGLSAEKEKVCREELGVRCCISKGESQDQCCAEVSPAAEASATCKTSSASFFKGEGEPTPEVEPCSPTAVETTCGGRSDAQLCRNEEYLKCCLASPKGSKDLCCRIDSRQVRQSAQCRPNLAVAAQRLNLASAAQLLCSPEVLEAACKDCA